MTGLPNTPSYEEDETLAKLQQALEDAPGVNMRAALKGAIEERKAELRRERRATRGAD
jgi:hypothetical protein